MDTLVCLVEPQADKKAFESIFGLVDGYLTHGDFVNQSMGESTAESDG